MIIDNSEQLKELLLFCDGEYRKFEAIIRQKDGKNDLIGNSDSASLKYWLIEDYETYNKMLPRMKKFCDSTGARLYITLDRKSSKKTIVNTAKALNDMVAELAFSNSIEVSIKRLNKVIKSETSKKQNTANKLFDSDRTRTWMIDVDDKREWIKQGIIDFLGENYITTLDTPNGYHIVAVKNFGANKFKDLLDTHFIHAYPNYAILHNEVMEKVELKENALGLVYCNSKGIIL